VSLAGGERVGGEAAGETVGVVGGVCAPGPHKGDCRERGVAHRFDQKWAFRGSACARWLRLAAFLFGNGIKCNGHRRTHLLHLVFNRPCVALLRTLCFFFDFFGDFKASLATTTHSLLEPWPAMSKRKQSITFLPGDCVHLAPHSTTTFDPVGSMAVISTLFERRPTCQQKMIYLALTHRD